MIRVHIFFKNRSKAPTSVFLKHDLSWFTPENWGDDENLTCAICSWWKIQILYGAWFWINEARLVGTFPKKNPNMYHGQKFGWCIYRRACSSNKMEGWYVPMISKVRRPSERQKLFFDLGTMCGGLLDPQICEISGCCWGWFGSTSAKT